MTESAGAQAASSPATETSVTGLSDEFVEAIRAYAENRNEKMRAVYDEAILDLAQRINGGETIFFPAVVAGLSAGRKSKPRHIRLGQDAMDAMTNLCDRLRVHRSVFFHKAMRDFLSSKGIDAPQ